jgi:hypothetical protein
MDAKTRAIFRQIMREIGAKGGKIGGKRSLETMTPEEGRREPRKPPQPRRRSVPPRGWPGSEQRGERRRGGSALESEGVIP